MKQDPHEIAWTRWLINVRAHNISCDNELTVAMHHRGSRNTFQTIFDSNSKVTADLPKIHC